jgi:hypothetical protein
MRFMLTALVGEETVMRTQSFAAEYAMRITFTLALVALTCSLLMACHPAAVTDMAVNSSGDAGHRVESTVAQASRAPQPAMEPVLAFDEKWVTPQ